MGFNELLRIGRNYNCQLKNVAILNFEMRDLQNLPVAEKPAVKVNLQDS